MITVTLAIIVYVDIMQQDHGNKLQNFVVSKNIFKTPYFFPEFYQILLFIVKNRGDTLLPNDCDLQL